MSPDQACDILRRKHGIDAVVESHGVICLIDISKDNIHKIRDIMKGLGYNKSWGIRPKSNSNVAPVIFDQEDTREMHVL